MSRVRIFLSAGHHRTVRIVRTDTDTDNDNDNDNDRRNEVTDRV